MKRRALLGGFSAGFTTLVSGCLSGRNGVIGGGTSGGSNSSSDNAVDAPRFEANQNTPAEPILLTAQEQAPNGVVLGDEFDIAIAIGNAGGGTLSGEYTLRLLPPTDDEPSQSDTLTIGGENTIPSGAARFFRIGPFVATATGTWELVAGPKIERVHSEYNGTFTVSEGSDDN
ncbi:hypothetical protein E2L06_18355 [Haloterrigena sp. H1]|uniref:hypothetical protein n=1 Tax=Haloterrigena sp. H1 TaxID=2552943 RepID=UPI00110F40FF|nr:hypothetical protein [Haloterrigena sp. H1]TMT80224.1 hypothetical protein E2L06_18355 [Haloterrigena sp. H1]